MDNNNPKGTTYLLSESIKNSIKVYGGNTKIFVAFDAKGRFLAHSNFNCFDSANKIFKTTIEALYLLLKLDFYSEIDFLTMKIIEKRILLNLSISQMAKAINVTVEEYINIEEGNIKISENMKRGICVKLNIKAVTKKEFINIYFKQIN